MPSGQLRRPVVARRRYCSSIDIIISLKDLQAAPPYANGGALRHLGALGSARMSSLPALHHSFPSPTESRRSISAPMILHSVAGWS
jgi:hypothetical protein